MEIVINGIKTDVAEKSNLQTIVDTQLGEKQKGIAVALNNVVIPKINWEHTTLASNDSVLIIKATQGG